MRRILEPTSQDGQAIPHRLPGADLVAKGIEALDRDQRTQEALLVALAAPRLRALGLPIPEAAFSIDAPNIALYESVRESGGGHSQYNALLRRLASFVHAYARVEPERRRITSESAQPPSASTA